MAWRVYLAGGRLQAGFKRLLVDNKSFSIGPEIAPVSGPGVA